MVKKAATKKEAVEERSPLYDAARKVLLAGIGAVALAQDEADNFVKKLVERGELAEKDARKLMEEVDTRRKETAQKAEGQVEERLESILSRMNVPTKSDIQALSEKIAALTEKVEALKKNGSAA
ncbi:MAG: hypothetical protein Fur0018_01370 [Anaerolineales bacterium]